MLDATQKAEILFYLGYPILEDAGPAIRALNSLDSRPEADALILAELATCKSLDQVIRQKVPLLALAAQDGAIQLRGHYTLGVLQAAGRQAAGRLSSFTSIAMKHDVFSSAAPVGDPPTDAIGNSYTPPHGGGCLPGC